MFALIGRYLVYFYYLLKVYRLYFFRILTVKEIRIGTQEDMILTVFKWFCVGKFNKILSIIKISYTFKVPI